MPLIADSRPLRHPPFRRLWAGSALSAIGGGMTAFAVLLQMYELTRSVTAVGALGAARALPIVVLGLFGGAVADARDRRRLVLATSSGPALVSVVLAVQAFAGLRQAWLLYVLVAVQAVLGAVDNPARRTFVSRLLPEELVPAGLALNQLSFQLSLMAGPALGGLLAAAGGVRLCYAADVISYAGAIAGVASLPAMAPLGGAAARGRAGARAVAEGLASSAASGSCSARSSPTSTRWCSACPSPCCRRSTRRASAATRARSAC